MVGSTQTFTTIKKITFVGCQTIQIFNQTVGPSFIEIDGRVPHILCEWMYHFKMFFFYFLDFFYQECAQVPTGWEGYNLCVGFITKVSPAYTTCQTEMGNI